ncbi:regulatory protein RecX [Aestuariivivens insulae]|uniref:regulatory protein RecX n=1 Tax=Aestuariivivens insulae TaxID=1621988 RepID=UPI001F58E8A9|nr:regulatory protein RecX [Aestuariivivens insulae]
MHQRKVQTVEEATKKLEHYCAYQERCHKEVRQKLIDMGMIPEAIDVILVHLIEQNFLNEERYAKTYVQGKFSIKNWGKRRLVLELKQKDISKRNIDIAINEIDDGTYLETFNNLAEKHAITIKETNVLKKKKKLADYLIYRGWESHLVYEKVNELIK